MTKIPFTNHYFIDKESNIYSINGAGRSLADRKKPFLMKQQTQNNGYKTVKIVFKGKRQTMSVGYLVLLTFVSDRPSENHQVCHGILGKSVNSIDNVSWKTSSENNKEDKERDKTAMLGEKHFASKIKNSDIPIIRQLNIEGKSNKYIAKIFNVHHSNISKIIRGHTWSHI